MESEILKINRYIGVRYQCIINRLIVQQTFSYAGRLKILESKSDDWNHIWSEMDCEIIYTSKAREEYLRASARNTADI